jgi:glutathione peroxidase
MFRALALAASLSTGAVVAAAQPALAAGPFTFPSIDGGSLSTADWAGRPVLVANTASLCGFTPQYDDLQTLWERYRDQGLVVLAVPSDDFRQELGDEAQVKEFCEVNFGLDFPMTEITHVRGARAHPFYVWLAETHGFAPRWNFNKVLLDGEWQVVATWGSGTRPTSHEITGAVEALLKD